MLFCARVISTILAIAVWFPFAAAAAEMGDKAAPLSIATWVQGDPVTVGQGDKVYVVEFWATWCLPCKESAPHLTELQRKYKDDLVVVGISDEEPSVVEAFVQTMGEKMDYTVAIDKDSQTYGGYLEAFGLNGYPTAFVVDRQGRITWHSHPMSQEFDDIVERVVSGAYDGVAAKKDAELLKIQEGLFNEFVSYCKSGDTENATAITDRMIEEHATSVDLMSAVAWVYLNAPDKIMRDPKRAVQFGAAAVKASEGKNARVLEIYARTLFESGDLEGAIREQERAVELAPERVRPQLQEQLEEYRAATTAEQSTPPA